MISGSLGLNEKYHARKLEIKEVPNQKTWFDTNHLQGGTGSRVAYGLFNGDECLAAMSFGAPRFNRNYQWEIVRFANALNTTVVGGASRLWAHFVKTHQPRSVISYADLRISQGKLYRTLGFQLSHRSAPNYFWCKAGGNVLPRYQTQKSKLAKLLKDFDGEKTEKANMQNAGWNRIWDAGNLVFVYNTDPDGHASQE